MSQTKAVRDVINAMSRNRAKHGHKDHSSDRWVGFIGEEMGEVHRALNEFHFGNGSFDRYRQELVDLASVTIQAIESYDAVADRVVADIQSRRAS